MESEDCMLEILDIIALQDIVNNKVRKMKYHILYIAISFLFQSCENKIDKNAIEIKKIVKERV